MAASPAPRVHQWALPRACLRPLLAPGRRSSCTASLRRSSQLQHGEDAATTQTTTFVSPNQNSLLTYYFDAFKPEMQLVRAAPPAQRPGRTPLRVKLAGPAAVSAFMPVMSSRASGMTHQVVNTWAALKNYALMFSRVNAVNEQAAAAGASSRLFPLPGVAVAAASDASASMDVARMINAAESQGQRRAWTEPSPGSVLLMPVGQSVAAVADVMNVAYYEAAGAITLDLDLVHDPDTVSEFQPHGKQTLDASSGHFYFFTPPGVRVDAAGLLKALAEFKYKLPGLHVFVKGNPQPCTVTTTSTAEGSNTFRLTFTATGDCSCTTCQAEKQPAGAPDGRFSNSGCLSVTITPDANAEVLDGTCDIDKRGDQDKGAAGARQQAILVAININGVGFLLIRLRGPVVVRPITLNGNNVISVPANGLAITPGTSKLAIAPAKAYRHVHDSITLTALPLDASGGAAAGVTVTFAVVGDCEPVLASAKAVTDAGGRASVVVSAKKPGAVAVVAAVTSTTGGTLVTPASHIIFFKERHYVEHKEHHYYGGGYDDRWGEAQAYTEIKPDADSDAECFASEATKKVVAQLAA